MTTARDAMTATINAAIARYDQAIGDGTWRTTARNQTVEHILRGWERTVTHAVEQAVQAATQPPRPSAIERAAQAARRGELDDALSQHHVRVLRQTKAGTG